MKCYHLNFVGESYVSHLLFTLQLGSILFLLSIISIVHGLCPWIMVGTVSDKLKHLNKILSER